MPEPQAPKSVIFVYTDDKEAKTAYLRLQSASRKVSFVVNPGKDIRVNGNCVEIDQE